MLLLDSFDSWLRIASVEPRIAEAMLEVADFDVAVPDTGAGEAGAESLTSLAVLAEDD